MLRLQFRHLSTTATATAATVDASRSSLYAFKKQLDEFLYFHSLSSQWKPAVYRKRNADMLTSLNALDKNHHPIVPREYPGIPSKKKLVKFISLLVNPEEISLIRQTLDGLFKVRLSKDKKLKYLDPSILNQFLYKSFQFNHDIYTKNLIWLDQIDPNDSVWSVKNTEAVAFVNAYLVKIIPKYTYAQYNEKLTYWIKKAQLDPQHSILYNAASLIAGTYGDSKTDLEAFNTAFKNLDNLTREKVYQVKPNTDYLQYDHAYSILSALKEAAEVNKELQPLVDRWSKFFTDVETIKDQPSSYESWKAAEAVRAAEAAETAKADETTESNTEASAEK
ncbi:hypothetical protein CANINC_000828 [Pichia inconspicua]|uniref:Uncharacterized protein n=1 Tax=Pichia inconspicua TaxID=52247 RepID=A0A4T0X5M1_9ASCO|nr:hypothetical protein CANINC_000828 [[Candida] inconspicua]